MPLLFSDICTLLSRCEEVELRDPPHLLASDKQAALSRITDSWFKSHRRAISDASAETATALLSTLLPERRTDRVYDLQAPRLCRVLSRVLGLSTARARDLQAYTRPGQGDLAACLERVLGAGGPPAIPAVTLAEVEDLFRLLAGCSRFSGPAVPRLPAGSSEMRDSLIGNLLMRLQPGEAKWLVRMILKDLAPVRLDERMILRSFHFLLPSLLRFQDDFDAVMALLKGPLREYPSHPDPRSEKLHRQSVAKSLKPVVGIKVGRPDYVKARSIAYCMDTIGERDCVLERKYDGEYCEIHIDLSRSPDPSQSFKIFSKSGKDSTLDRKGLHQTLIDCFDLGTSRSKIKRQAILLGEMVVYSDEANDILPFDHIRKHVQRSGMYLGIDRDSPPKPCEHLAIVFFDLLLLDDEVVMTKSVEERRCKLRQVYRKIPGRALGAEWKVVSFKDQTQSRKRLLEQFAASAARRCEGLVLKPCGSPYFSVEADCGNGRGSYMKLKKDYIADLGDEADFAVIGASYNAQTALKAGTPGVKWTTFHLGCLLNKDDAIRFGQRPCYRVVGAIAHGACIPRPVLQTANLLGSLTAKPFNPASGPANFDIEAKSFTKMDVCFDSPLVFEVLGSGFDRPTNSDFLMLRHARVKKLHQDRSWESCISFQELQELGRAARDRPETSESQETLRWIDKMERKCKRKFDREHTTTPRTRTGTSSATPDGASLGRQGPITGGNDHSASMGRQQCFSTGRPAPDSDSHSGCAGGISSSGKRQRADSYETPCRQSKRPKRTPAGLSTGSCPTALSEVTNLATSSSWRRRRSPEKPAQPAPLYISARAARLRAGGRSLYSHVAPQDTGPDPPQQCPRSSFCIFANATIHVSACIASTPYIVEDLLAGHDITRVPDLSHWDRDAHAFPAHGPTVAESQSHPGQRKLMLVEARRRAAVLDLVRALLRLAGGCLRERIEVYDWRALEECAGVATTSRLRRHLLGATMFDVAAGRAVFVTDVDWLQRGLMGAD